MRKKLLIINGSSDLYGANRILALTIDSLKVSYDITLFIPGAGPLSDFILQKNSQVEIQLVPQMPIIQRSMRSISGSVKFIMAFSWFFLQLLRNPGFYRSFDLIFINTLSCAPMIFLFKSFKFRVLVHVHEILSNQDMVTKGVNRLALTYSDTIISVSAEVKGNLVQACRSAAEQEKILVIQNGIEDLLDTGMQVNDERLVFSLFGRIKPEKGQWYLLEALRLIDSDVLSKALFRVIGSPTPDGTKLYHGWLEEVEALRKNHGLNLEVIGFVNDISSYLNATDVVLVPSLMQDPFPTVILEGLSAGKIVLATDSGGSKESIQHGVNGILMESTSAVNFADILTRIILHSHAYAEMKVNARNSYLKNFTVDRYKKNISDLVEAKFPAK